jgi:hypothetical protein
VDKAANLGGAVKLGAFLFETADAQHIAQQLERVITFQCRLRQICS